MLKNKNIILSLLGVLFASAIILNIKTYEEVVISKNKAIAYATNTTEIRSAYLKEHFEKAEVRLSSLRNTILNLDKADKFDRQLITNILSSNLNKSENLLSIWVYLEPNAMDIDSLHLNENGSLPNGRFAPWLYFDRNNSSIIQNVCSSDQLIFYALPKELKRTVLLEPYQTENGGEETYFITIAQPMLEGGFKGVMGTDWFWEDFNKIMSAKPYGKNSHAYLISSSGQILSHEDEGQLGKKVDDSILKQIVEVRNGYSPVKHLDDVFRVTVKLDLPYSKNDWYLVNEIPDSNDLFSVIRSNQLIWRIGFFSMSMISLLTFALIYIIIGIIKDKNKINSQLKSSLESSFEGIIVIDAAYKYQRINNEYSKGVKSLFGIDVEESQDAFESVPEPYGSSAKRLVKKALKGNFFIHDLKIKGNKFRFYFNPIDNQDHITKEVMIRIVDITDAHKDQEEIEHYRKNLEVMVSERTKELRQVIDRLKETRVKLIENEKVATLGLLSSGLANEITSPVNFVVGNIIPLKKDIEDISRLIEIVNSNVDQLNFENKIKNALEELTPEIILPEIDTLINGIEEGTSRIKELVLNFNEIIRPDRQGKFENINRGINLTMKFIRSRINENVKILTLLDPELPSTYCDMGKLNDVILSLIWYSVNSVLQGQGGIIKIKTHAKNNVIVIEVISEGKTLHENKIQNLFDPFLCIKDVNSDVGLGIALSKKIIEAHGGIIQAINEDNLGLIFRVEIPILKQPINS